MSVNKKESKTCNLGANVCVSTGFVNNDAERLINNDNGVQLFYRWVTANPKKNKEVLVFIHGDVSNSVVWQCQQKFFSADYNTLAIDLRGFGNSSKYPGPLSIDVHIADLAFLFKELHVDKMILVGWSMGGLVVQGYTLAYPDQVTKLVLVDTAPSIVERIGYPWGRSLELEAEIVYTITTDFDKYATDGSAAAIPETCPQALAVKNKIYELIIESTQATALRSTLDVVLFNSIDQLANLTLPTLIFVGAKDGAINPNCSFFMRERIPNSQLIEFPFAGHAPFLTYTDEFNKYLHDFLKYDSETPCTDCTLFIDGPLVYSVNKNKN
jgi:pimeloyl-ACP methyl ester carboxylesterase